MKEKCPKCEYKFGFRGPKQKIEKYKLKFLKISDNKIRYFCPSCSVELSYYDSNVERLFKIIGFVGLFFISIDQILHLLNYDFLPEVMFFFFSITGVLGLTIGTFLLIQIQHYKIKVSHQINPADAKGSAAD